MDLDKFYRNLNGYAHALTSKKERIASHKKRIIELEKLKTSHTKAIGVLDKTIEIISGKGIGRIEEVVSDGLQLVFGKGYNLIIERKEGARGNTYRILVKHGDVVGPPLETVGGGVVNVISFLLRVIMIQRFKLTKFIALDESFNNVGNQHLPKVSQMIKTLCDEHGYCMLSVTHQPILAAAADQIFEVLVNSDGPLLRELRQEEKDEYRAFNASAASEASSGNTRTVEGTSSSAS